MRISPLWSGILLISAGFMPAQSGKQSVADQIRATERERVSALVKSDVTTASRLIADDFQLINPAGGVLSKKEYLGQIAAGDIKYLQWDPGQIEVKLFGNAAVIRYLCQANVRVKAIPDAPVGRIWFTDLYELRNGRWQIVWSQGTPAR